MPGSFHLGLPLIEAGQAQKHVTHNEAIGMLDAIVMLSVIDRDHASPPLLPEEGERYLVKPAGSGAFAGKDNCLAHFDGGDFVFVAPRKGWLAYVEAEDTFVVFDGAAWSALRFDGLQNLDRLGVGTAADETNPLAAKLNNALFTAREAGEGGDGDLRCKFNKETAGNTASMLFQTGYSGRAEIGLTGDDDFRFKVSADGSSWRDGIVVASATGKVSFPQGALGLREKLTASRTYYVRTDGNDANDGSSNDAGGAFLTIQKAVNVVFGTLDLGGFNVTIQVADGTYAGQVVQSFPQVGAGLVTIKGNAAAPANVLIATTPGATVVENGAVLRFQDMKIQSANGSAIRSNLGATAYFSNIDFGACGYAHLRPENGGRIFCQGSYRISGNAPCHVRNAAGLIRVEAITVTLDGARAFSLAYAHADGNGVSYMGALTFAGSATGKRYDAQLNGTIIVNGGGATYLPGDTAGTAATGGQYI